MAHLKLEIADTADKQMKGLMFRHSLPSDRGMLFKFEQSIGHSFWGRNTYIPLDLAFIGHDNRILQIDRITPHSTKHIRSNFPSSMAIEANVGFFEEHQIKPGDRVEIDVVDGVCIANFRKES